MSRVLGASAADCVIGIACAGGVSRISEAVFHSPQCGQRPNHFFCSLPQLEHMKTDLAAVFVMLALPRSMS
jgi:hypothetical protein